MDDGTFRVGRAAVGEMMKRNGKRPRHKTINCAQCDAVLNVNRDLRTRAVKGHNNVMEMGLKCWRCGQWVHVYFSGPELDRRRTDYQKAQRRAISTMRPKDRDRLEKARAAYQTEFDRFNKEMRYMLVIRMNRDWAAICEAGITAGYIPGGSAAGMYESGKQMVGMLRGGLWQPGDLVVEVGSGNGRIAMGLLDENVRYVGLEIIPECVSFCQDAFAGIDGFRFAHLDVYNSHYNGRGRIRPEQMVLPLADETADCVLAISLFSHLGTTAVAERYLQEMARVLKPGGKLLSTWFKSPPHKPSQSEGRTVFVEGDIRSMIGKWFAIVAAEAGDALGPPHNQWRLTAVKEDV